MFTPIKTVAVALSIAVASTIAASSSKPEKESDCAKCQGHNDSLAVDSLVAMPHEVFVTRDGGTIWAAMHSTQVPPLRTISDNQLANLASCLTMICEANGIPDRFPAIISQLYINEVDPVNFPDSIMLSLPDAKIGCVAYPLDADVADMMIRALIDKKMSIAIDRDGNAGVVTAIEFIPDSTRNLPVQIRLRITDPDPGMRRITLDLATFAENFPTVIFPTLVAPTR